MAQAQHRPGPGISTSIVSASIVPAEVERFGRLAAQWWDPAGPMRALHAMNPARIGWIDQRLRARFGAPVPLLDVGCGAGLASEALARRGHAVLGIDAAANAVAAARAHCAGQGLPLEYREGGAESLVAEGRSFPAVMALEVIEHVADPAAFMVLLARLAAPGGLVFVSTLNRTLRSFAVAKLGAEYLLRLLPAGTHDWRRFVTPAELGGHARGAGLRMTGTAGLVFNPLQGRWHTARDCGVNYIASFARP